MVEHHSSSLQLLPERDDKLSFDISPTNEVKDLVNEENVAQHNWNKTQILTEINLLKEDLQDLLIPEVSGQISETKTMIVKVTEEQDQRTTERFNYKPTPYQEDVKKEATISAKEIYPKPSVEPS